jgi:hypothetical protein
MTKRGSARIYFAAFFALHLIFSFLASCAASQASRKPSEEGRPDWVSAHSKKFPSEFYITGVGQSTNRLEAEDRARAQIAKFLKITVSSTETYAETETISEGAGKLEQKVGSDVKAESCETVSGVEIAEVFQDDAGTFYALAVLPKERAEAQFKEKLTELENLIVRAEQSSDDYYYRLMITVRALAAVPEREELLLKLKALSIAPPAGDEKFTGRREEIQKRLAEMPISLKITGDHQVILAEPFKNAIIGAGIAVNMQGDQPPRAEIACKEEIIPRGDPSWTYLRISCLLNLVDEKENVRGHLEFEQQSVGLTKAQAREKTLRGIAAKIKSEFSARFLAALAGENK